APTCMHGKMGVMHHDGTGVFADIPNDFTATRYHSLVLERDSLPDCFNITAETDGGVIMGISHKEFALHGIQFHPESIASEHGHKMLGNFLELTKQ
ncbi:MAG: anthranilate synthase component II, partial [Alphaproteobacteria bacterium]